MKNLNKIASILALLIGGLSVIAGSKVLLGIDLKNYNILNWLVIYNVVLGAVSIAVSYVIWKRKSFIRKSILFVLSTHTIIAFYLYFFSQTVAVESIKAMSFRVAVWVLILILTFNVNRK